jgi:hypothetical protein
MLLAEYEESFSTYTMKQFMEDYMMNPCNVQGDHKKNVIKLQSNFSITSVKVLLVSLLNAFRDLTLMGVQVSCNYVVRLTAWEGIYVTHVALFLLLRRLTLITSIMFWCQGITEVLDLLM